VLHHWCRRYGFCYILLVSSAFAEVAVSRLDATVHSVSRERRRPQSPAPAAVPGSVSLLCPCSQPASSALQTSPPTTFHTQPCLPARGRHGRKQYGGQQVHALAHSPTSNTHTRARAPPPPPPNHPHTADLCAHQLLDALQWLAQLMQDTSELVLIIFA
jgi:hypothetical protein